MNVGSAAATPWSFDAQSGQIKDRRGNVLAIVHPSIDAASALSIGRLVAAAPELLEACRYTDRTIKRLAYIEDKEDSITMLNRCRQAYVLPSIIKAEEGEQ